MSRSCLENSPYDDEVVVREILVAEVGVAQWIAVERVSFEKLAVPFRPAIPVAFS